MLRRRFLVSMAWIAVASGSAWARDGGPRLALAGYDPVAYFTVGKPTKGEARFNFVYDDTKYHFVSAQNRDIFAANPEKYVPQYNGYCAMGMSKGHKIEADPNNWAIIDGQLFVAATPIPPGSIIAGGNTIKDGKRNWEKLHAAP